MAKICGIGGAFIFAQNTRILADWYEHNLGFSFESMGESDQLLTYYQVFSTRDLDNPDKQLHTVFAIMPAKQLLSDPRNQSMINYRVDDMDGLVKQLSEAGIAVDPIEVWAEGEGSGKFTHLRDPEGNRIELWQPLEE